MAKKFPIDEFDSATVHGGRHRARRTARDRVIEWLRLFIAAAIVAGVGFGLMKIVDGATVFDGYIPGAAASPSASSSVGPAVSVLDGGGNDLAGKAGQLLKDEGFNVVDASTLLDANKKPVSIKVSTVVIVDEIFRAQAESVAAKLGSKSTPAVIVSPEFKGPITVVLGADYKIPAAN